MRDEHLTPDLLRSFLRGEASKAENREVVRHLLAGCPECLAVARPLWRRVDGRGRGKRHARLARQGRF